MSAAPRAHAYCVDGTNLVRAGGYAGPAFQAQEQADAERLIAGLSAVCEALDGRVDVELFFDGSGWAGRRASAPNLHIRCSREVPADDLILDRVRTARHTGRGRVTVVTGDGELGRRAAEEGGRWQRVAAGTDLSSVFRAIERRFSR